MGTFSLCFICKRKCIAAGRWRQDFDSQLFLINQRTGMVYSLTFQGFVGDRLRVGAEESPDFGPGRGGRLSAGLGHRYGRGSGRIATGHGATSAGDRVENQESVQTCPDPPQ